MHMKYKDCGLTVGLAEEFIPSMRYSRIKEKYTQHGTGLNTNEVNNKDEKLWFQSTTSFHLLKLIAQLIFV